MLHRSSCLEGSIFQAAICAPKCPFLFESDSANWFKSEVRSEELAKFEFQSEELAKFESQSAGLV